MSSIALVTGFTSGPAKASTTGAFATSAPVGRAQKHVKRGKALHDKRTCATIEAWVLHDKQPHIPCTASQRSANHASSSHCHSARPLAAMQHPCREAKQTQCKKPGGEASEARAPACCMDEPICVDRFLTRVMLALGGTMSSAGCRMTSWVTSSNGTPGGSDKCNSLSVSPVRATSLHALSESAEWPP